MSRYYQVPHHATVWLLLGALWAVLPILWRGPVTLLVVVLLLLGWRWQIARARLTMPGKLLRLGLLLLLVLLTLWHYGTIFGPDAGVALLAASFTLKLLEMFRLRDAYVALVLGYFVLAMVFLFEQGALITLYVLLGFVWFTAALVGINQADDKGRALAHLRKAGVMVAKALPLMLVIFVVVPRVAPLWGFSLNTDQARTGLSSSMAPGSISDISQSSEPVFRVEFQDQIPPPEQRYWRGLTYSWFDGESWRQSRFPLTPDQEIVQYPRRSIQPWFAKLEQEKQKAQPQYSYRVLMEPSGQRWLFALDVPFSESERVGLARDYRLLNRDSVDQAMAYRVESYALTMDKTLPGWLRSAELALPQDGNLRARAMAKAWRAESGSDSAYIQRLLNWFHTQPFYYTLHPPKLIGADSIDNFLFGTRQGFCAHYASAFTFMMRAAGIPARVVAGYQGGQLNPLGQYLQVRQYDAHAWVEVWLDGQGWVREDPTAAVAPERIKDGIFAALQQGDEPAGANALNRWAQQGLFARLGMMGDYMTYLWQRWVVNYDQGSQRALFSNWFGKINFYQLLLIATSLVLSLALMVFVYLRWRERRALTAWQRQYLRLRQALRKRGVDVNPAFTPKQQVIKACVVLPEKRQSLLAWLAAYQALAYANCSQVEQRARLKRLSAAFPF